jgi:phosphoenolpyruvate carboxylase
VLIDSLDANHGGMLARPRLTTLKRAAEIFGFHLASLDMRQSSDIHERVLAELFAKSGAHADYSALDEDAKVKLLLAELRSLACCIRPTSAIRPKRIRN